MHATTKKGNKNVYFLTINAYLRRATRTTVNVSRRIAADNPSARNHIIVNGRANMTLHKIATSYSYNMGGSDLADMKIHQSTAHIKSGKCWTSVMFFLFNAILHNAHVVYCKIKNEIINISFREFKKSVAKSLINGNSYVKKQRKRKRFYIFI